MSSRGTGKLPEIPADGEAPSFEEGHLIRVRRLERMLGDQRAFALKSTRQLHRTMLREVTAAEKRAREAEKRASVLERRLKEARRRAKAAEAELQALRTSTTWRAGETMLAVPRRIKKRIRP